VKGFWRVVTKRPTVQGSEKWGVKWSEVKCSAVMWSEVKWNEVFILGEICVLPLIYSYVAVCRFCAVSYHIIICFSLSCSICWTYVLKHSSYVCFLSCIFVFYFVYFVILYCFCIVLCIVSPFVLSLSYFCTSLPITATGWKPNCSK